MCLWQEIVNNTSSWHASCALSGNRVLIHGGYNGNHALEDSCIFNLGKYMSSFLCSARYILLPTDLRKRILYQTLQLQWYYIQFCNPFFEWLKQQASCSNTWEFTLAQGVHTPTRINPKENKWCWNKFSDFFNLEYSHSNKDSLSGKFFCPHLRLNPWWEGAPKSIDITFVYIKIYVIF